VRILVFGHDSSLYGASQSLLTLIDGLVHEYGYKVLLLLPYPGELIPVLTQLNIDHLIVPFPRCVIQTHNKRFSINRLKMFYQYYRDRYSVQGKLINIINDFDPDLIYTNTSVVSIGYELSKKLNRSHIWHVREFGALDYNFNYIPSRKRIQKNIKSSRTIFISRSLQKYWLNNDTLRSKVIYNGIQLEENTLSVRKLSKMPIKIGMIGAITPGKGQDIGIKAFSKVSRIFPDCKLCLYGEFIDNNYKSSIIQLISNCNLKDQVVFKGFEKSKKEIYPKLDLLINCSNSEGFGRSIVEAMFFGVPVIANNSGGIPEIIDDGLNGLLYNGSEDDLTEKMLLLFSQPELYESLSTNGIEKASRCFSARSYIGAINEVLKQSINKL
jgi:glycosyltransferase involved in cell wall biosynthesis